MMIKTGIAALTVLVMLVGCGERVNREDAASDFLSGRVLKDKDGCAFTTRHSEANRGTYFKFNRDESSPTCTFKE